MTDLSDDEIARFVDGEETATRAAEIGERAAQDELLRARIASERALRASLACDPELDVADVLPAVRAALRVPARRPPLRRMFAWTAPPAALLAAALALVMVQRRDDDGFRSKGLAGAGSSTGVTVFHQAGARLLPVDQRVHSGDGIAFAYTNASATPFSHLMIFAVDDARRIFWYWPAFVAADADPRALRAIVLSAGRDVELADVVRHALVPGRLTVYAAFLRGAVSVADVERAVARGGAPPFDLGVEASWQAVPLEVVP